MLRLLLGVLLLAVASTRGSAGTYFVARDGKADGDGAAARPWRSVADALSRVGGGNTIVVKAGIYPGPFQIRNYPAPPGGPPTLIRSEEKWKAVVNGGEQEAINIVRRNIVRHNAGYGLHLYPQIKGALVSGNLVFGHANHAGIIVACPEGGGGNRIANNTVVGGRTCIEIWRGDGFGRSAALERLRLSQRPQSRASAYF